MEITDSTVLQAASWRLASELVRRHPNRLRLFRGHPGGGQGDALMIRDLDDSRPGSIILNRIGSLQIDQRFDGRQDAAPSTSWEEYLASNPIEFLRRFEEAAGLTPPPSVPSSTPRTLTYRVLAAAAATAFKTTRFVDIQLGYIDSSGYGAGPNTDAFDAFPYLPKALTRRESADWLGEPGYRFWFLLREDHYLAAIEQERGLAWRTNSSQPVDLLANYRQQGRDVLAVALPLLIEE